MSRRTYTVTNGSNDGWVVLLIAAMFVVYGQEILILATVVALVWVALRFVEARQQAKALKMVNEAAISMKADHENLLASMGDPAGVYGDWTPVTMPMTRDYTAIDINTERLWNDRPQS